MGFREGEHISVHVRMKSVLLTQSLHVIGIREATHIKHRIRLGRDTVFEAERHTANVDAVVLFACQCMLQDLCQLGGCNIRGIDTHVRALIGVPQHLPLTHQSVLHACPVPERQRMKPSGEFIPIDKHIVPAIQIQNPAGIPCLPQRLGKRSKRTEIRSAAHIGNDGQFITGGGILPMHIDQHADHIEGDVIHTGISPILKDIGRTGFSRTRASCQKNNIHPVSFILPVRWVVYILSPDKYPRRNAFSIRIEYGQSAHARQPRWLHRD